MRAQAHKRRATAWEISKYTELKYQSSLQLGNKERLCGVRNKGGGGLKRGEITKQLSELTEKLINPYNDTRIYWAKEVTFDYFTIHPIRVDYMKFKPVNNTVSGIEKGDFYCYEVKSSVEDFHSKNGHNFIGDFNYYIMPHEVYTAVQGEIPFAVGVYCPNSGKLRSVKKAKRKDRDRPALEMLLMMFRSAARDIEIEGRL